MVSILGCIQVKHGRVDTVFQALPKPSKFRFVYTEITKLKVSIDKEIELACHSKNKFNGWNQLTIF